jgi:hypothetical protein
MESSAITFCQRPSFRENLRRGQEVNLVSNYMKISFRPNEKFVRQYHLKFDPEVPAENEALRRSIYRGISKEMRNYYHPFVTSGDSLFSAKDVDEQVSITFSYSRPEEETPVEYRITIIKTENELDLSNVKSYENFSQKVKSFVEVVIKNILNANRGMVRFNGRSVFNYENSIQLQDFGKKYF